HGKVLEELSKERFVLSDLSFLFLLFTDVTKDNQYYLPALEIERKGRALDLSFAAIETDESLFNRWHRLSEVQLNKAVGNPWFRGRVSKSKNIHADQFPFFPRFGEPVCFGVGKEDCALAMKYHCQRQLFKQFLIILIGEGM